MYELNVKDDYSQSNQENDNDNNNEEKMEKKRKNSKKAKNKNYNDKLKDEFLKKSDENEYLGNKSLTKITDDEYNKCINFKTAFSYFSSCNYKEEQELINQEKNLYDKKKNCLKKIYDCFYNRISQKINSEKNLLCCITKVKYDESNDIHYKILYMNNI